MLFWSVIRLKHNYSNGFFAHVHMQCPDPYFKKRHHKRRVVQKPLVDSIVNSLMPSGQV